MTIYDKQRSSLQQQMDVELSQLDSDRNSMSDVDYWKCFKQITDKYKDKLKSVDDAERLRNSLLTTQSAKFGQSVYSRPEQGYADILGQLKAQKLSQLISKLSQISSNNEYLEPDISDPFYADKKDPISVFEQWWKDELSDFPSIHEVKDFLNRIDINDKGYIVFNDAVSSCVSSRSDSAEVMLPKSSHSARKYKDQLELKKLKRKSPLLANTIQSNRKAARKLSKSDEILSSFTNVINAYNLDEFTSDLLIEHAEKVCIVKGILHVDEYQHMLEQFLRYCTDYNERIKVIKRAIEKGWRVLSDGTI